MRVLSFISAFLLAAASFVAAAPAPGDTSCSPLPSHTGNGNGNDAPLQPVIAIIANATNSLTTLQANLGALHGDACTPDAVSGIVVQISAVVSFCADQLQAVGTIDLSGLDYTTLCATIYAHLTVIVGILNILVGLTVTLGASAIVAISAVVNGLLHAILHLVTCIQVFVDASLTAVLGPVFGLVCGGVTVLISIVAQISATVSA